MSKGAKKIEVSEATKSEARLAAARHNERIDDGYIGLEQKAIADSGRDHSGYIKGRGSAGLAQSETDAVKASVRSKGAGLRELSRTGDAIAAGVNAVDVSSAQTARNLNDEKSLAVAKTGQDIADSAASGLRAGSTLSTRTAIQKLNNDILVSDARSAAMGEAAGAVVNGATMRADGYRLGKDGLSRTRTTTSPDGSGADVEVTDKLGWKGALGAI